MNESQKMLLLQYSEVEELISKTRGDSYSDNNKSNYHNSLINLFKKIKEQDLSKLDLPEIQETRSYLKFIFNCLVFLRDSSLNSIPFEIVRCLNNAMQDWVQSDDFIIVTGLTKDLYAFSFFLDYTRDDFFYQSIKIKYGVEFKQKLVQINLPITLCKDYISTVPLYHELGHFIEKQYDVALHAYGILLKPGIQKEQDIQKYFPYIDDMTFQADGKHERNRANMFYNHLMEYFCDLFAAQYIGTTSNVYLNSISTNNTLLSETHPSALNRESMVKDFLEGKVNLLIHIFNEILSTLVGKPLQKRHSTINSDDFYKLIPFVANNDEELHGIFDYGWRIWLHNFTPFEPMLGDANKIPGGKIYQIINSLMEKSIGNYFITKEWNSKK